MLVDVTQYILGRTEGRGLGFGRHVNTHTGKCLKCQSSSDWYSDHSALCTGRRKGEQVQGFGNGHQSRHLSRVDHSTFTQGLCEMMSYLGQHLLGLQLVLCEPYGM